ncbi:MAG: aspartate aminotransferase family protein [Deltaproteobacteria bacterium]|nr:aspartate aminotransferase family protein [Deltaproteobacteria bacterium]
MQTPHQRRPMPAAGRDEESILADLVAYGGEDPKYKDGRTMSLVYYLDEGHDDFLAQAWKLYSSANGLNPTAFKSLKRFESEIIEAVAELHHGGPDTCGVVTSGGTESCLLAVKTYRDYMRAKKPWLLWPEMVLPRTAHVAWLKASEYFGVKIRFLPMGKDHRVDLSRLKKLINRNTVMVLASAPEYPHGFVEPVEEMAAVAQRAGVPLHVDACVGGFVMPFVEKNGRPVPRWDYRVPGVTSISADIHKYGFSAKGASTITYRSMEYMKHQMFVEQDWPGGVFASPALLGTRPGGSYAAAWATLQLFGEAGYRDLAERAMKAADGLKAGISKIDGLQVIGDPPSPLFSYRSVDPDLNIFAVGDQMAQAGWHVDRLQFPDALHAMITARHLEVVDAYLADLRAAVDTVRANPELAKSGTAATYGLMAHVPLRGMVKKQVLELFSDMYRPGGSAIELEGGEAIPGADEEGLVGTLKGAANKAVEWYVDRKMRQG